MNNKVVRSVCVFSKNPNDDVVYETNKISSKLKDIGYEIQTRRICSPFIDPKELKSKINDPEILLSVGTLTPEKTKDHLKNFYQAKTVSFNTDLTNIDISKAHVEILFDIIKNKPSLTFNFAYVFNNRFSSPYYPSANYEKDGFAIGLQPTNLAGDCKTLQEWLEKIRQSWLEIDKVFKKNSRYLGIDSSIAPIFDGKGSLINFIKKLGQTFEQSVTTDTYIQITNFLIKNNPKPVGLCGLMFPCLEDFELTQEYEAGRFTIERNVFLSLHSGLGIDTYPIGIDENPERVVDVLKLVAGLSKKYSKPLSVRFVSDGKAKIGDKTNFGNQYLKDVVVRSI